MKRNLFATLFFLISCSGIAFSQEYLPLLENHTWIAYKYHSGQVAPSPNKFVEEPTAEAINGVMYKRFIDPFINTGNMADSYVYLREDIHQKKVFRLMNGSEMLIYDFSLENGDTFIQGPQVYTATVNDTILGSTTRKKITLQLNGTEDSSFRQTWIEGIGGTSHPLAPYYNVQSYLMVPKRKNWTHLRCAFQSGEHLYGLEYCAALLKADGQNILSNTINIYPNPVLSEINIQYDKGFQNVQVKIFNAIGQLVRQVDDQKGQLITLGVNDLSSGFYTVQLSDNEKVLDTKKVLIK